MAPDFRILHLADSHIGADLPARPRRRQHRRGDDIVASYRRALAAARNDVDLVIHAGDVFDLPRPNGAAVAAAGEPLLELAASGIPVVIVPGNHERALLPESLLFAHANMHIVRCPQTLTFNLRGTRVAVATFPCARRQAAGRFGELLGATAWAQARADVNVLAVHQTFESATCGPAGYRFRSGDDVVERGAVPGAFGYVAAGHIHRHQVLETPAADGPPIVYPGSPERISFAERDEPKGVVLLESSGGRLTHRFVEHAVRPMQLVPLNVTGLTRARLRAAALEQVAALPPESVTLLRLSGQTTRSTLRGLHLGAEARAARPDVLLSVSSQAVEFVPERQASHRAGNRRSTSAFAQLDSAGAAASNVTVCSVSERLALPDGSGTYAFHDAEGRLLYVGKAKNVRTRVRAHLAARAAPGHFGGWTYQIARIEARAAHSELEALLVEAELIRRLRPAFNRQMRLWSRYCYLGENGQPHGQLEILREPPRGVTCFGPYRGRAVARDVLESCGDFFGLARCPADRSGPRRPGQLARLGGGRLCRRYFVGACAGPCAQRIGTAEYGRRLQQRNALLAGQDDGPLRPLERQLEGGELSGIDEAGRSALARQVGSLRAAFRHGTLLGCAERLLGGLVLLPGPRGARTVILLTPGGIHLDVLHPRLEQAQRVLTSWHERVCSLGRTAAGRLPKSIADSLCTAARELRRGVTDGAFIPAAVAETLTPPGLLALAEMSGSSRPLATGRSAAGLNRGGARPSRPCPARTAEGTRCHSCSTAPTPPETGIRR
jgi:DNA repair exonuclease SbcCD nuclease subunit